MRGTTVTLYTETQTGVDVFGAPIYEKAPVTVEDVLIGEPTTDDIAQATALYQKVIRFMLGIPKGDTHDWQDKDVEWTDAYGNNHKCHTFGYPITGIEANVPTRWHMKVRCEEYG